MATPEMCTFMDLGARSGNETARAADIAHAVSHFGRLAAELGCSLLLGSVPVPVGRGMSANRSFLIDAKGEITAWYDKIHMFDVTLSAGEAYRESDTYNSGDRLVVADIGRARIGLSICYDLRFPALYRDLAQAGATLLAVPAAFTRTTGQAHWHVLLRARAIETGCFVIAPAQGGRHEDGRETFGHSLVVAPWGEVIAEMEDDEPGVLQAEIDLAEVENARSRVPSLALDRTWSQAGSE